MLSNKMKAAVLHKPRDVRIEQVSVPQLVSDSVLVRVGAVGVCGSDVHYYVEGRIGRYVVEKPLILGHESAGTVEAVGDQVAGLRPGERVAIEPGVPCRRCEYCKKGRYNLCPDVVFMATPPIDGAFCEYITTPADFAHKLPGNMSLDEGALMEPLSVGLAAVRRGRVSPGERVAILGAGPIGLMVLLASKAYGACETIVVDLDPVRLQMAQRMGATRVIDATKQDPGSAIGKDHPQGMDVVIEAAGSVPTEQLSTRLVRRGGRIVWVGLPGQEQVPISVLEVVDKEVDILSVFRYANTYPEAIQLVASGLVDVKPMITHHLPLDGATQALELMHTRADGALKVVVTP